MTKDKKILVSGVKPTGRPHIGNYLGAIKQFVDLQDTHECYVFIADLHALTSIQNRETLQELSLGVAMDYLAVGLDPLKTTIYKQSDVYGISDLGWIFNCITTMPYLMRAHAFKDAEAKNKEINVGTFDYPILMAADILIQDADIVPVGQDQKQHVEYARDTAEKFNRIYGQTFNLPEALIQDDVKTVLGTDARKMSKSYNNTIGLFASNDEIKKAIMSIPTDSKAINEPKDPFTDTLFSLHTLFTKEGQLEDVRHRYENGGIGYKESKDILIENLITFIDPMRTRRHELEQNVDYVKEVLKKGGERASKRAESKMKIVRDKVGLTF